MTKKGCMLNPKVKAYTETVEGRAMFCIVREFLQFFDLGFTISVYEPESYMGTSYNYDGKLAIIKDLGLSQLHENSKDPLLLQLIRLLQLHNNNTISKSELVPCATETIHNPASDTSNDNSIRTEISNNTHESNTSLSDSIYVNGKSENCKSAALNVTFNLSNPNVITNQGSNRAENNTLDESNCAIIKSETDNTTTTGDSTERDEENEKKLSDISSTSTETQNNLLAESTIDLELLSPVLKESKLTPNVATEKHKLPSQKSDKLKCKSSVNSLTDLPSLQISRNRSNDPVILPSLYSHEFKEKTSFKETDELLRGDLDSLDNYEEDFMSTSKVDLSSDCLRNNIASGSTTTNETKTGLTNDCMASENVTDKLNLNDSS